MIEVLDKDDYTSLVTKYLPRFVKYIGVSEEIREDYPDAVLSSLQLTFTEDSGQVNVQLKAIVKKSQKDKKEWAQATDIISFKLRQLPGACGVLVFYDGYAKRADSDTEKFYWDAVAYSGATGASPFGYKDGKGHDLWTEVIELVKDYARLTNYGIILATDNDESSSDQLADKLSIPIVWEFTSPRTFSDISVYIIDVSEDMEYVEPDTKQQEKYKKLMSGPILMDHNKKDAKPKRSKQAVSRKLFIK